MVKITAEVIVTEYNTRESESEMDIEINVNDSFQKNHAKTALIKYK